MSRLRGDLHGFLMQLVDDRRGRAGRRHQPEPGDRLEIRKPGFGDGRQLGHVGRALERRDREAAQRCQRAPSAGSIRHVLQRHGHAAADHVGEHGAAIRNMDDVDTRQALEQLAADVLRGADAGRGVRQFAGLRLGERDQLGKLLAGTSLLTTRMLGITRTRAIGARSRTGS